ncbi:P-loop containing nucleoside triphosphate hydrolase protein [Macrolepiota fuliginosa MF-IS2]|uniref:RNA helicase n=1 Tax=Macrolepiota fuliginosa MF-IS2 TaxID=1400762 RepID=A0A9P5X8F9_9AGAR|nr:P-loop containing nucleoside triphosphate hydrolase protein [Macrolepiota fuliginosa MF-IS2]
MYTALRRSSKVRSTGQLCSHLHSSAVQNGVKKGKGTRSSRTRLVQDLKPSSSSGKYEVAQEDRGFSRQGAPHQDPQLVEKHQGHSWRQRRTPLPPPRTPGAPKPTGTPQERVKSPQSTLKDFPESEFYHPPSPVSLSPSYEEENSALPKDSGKLPTKFQSPSLLPGFISSLNSMLGPDARPTPIQALSIKWLIEQSASELPAHDWKQFLLASETGSGKSLAYLLPLLQRLKLDEESGAHNHNDATTKRALNPRAIILAPTHELARQLSSFTKALARDVKLRAMCASQANTPNTTKWDVTAKKLSEQLVSGDDAVGELDVKKGGFPVDILVGTPVKIMELIRGRGWDRLQGELELDEEGRLPKLRRGRDKMPGVGRWKKEPGLGLENVEWVIVDEADVLFDPDFQEVTRTLLADISAARGQTIKVDPNDPSLSSFAPLTPASTTVEHINYPFNLILTSATIPKNLAAYLDRHHPNLIRLTSPRLHHLPKNLATEYVSWTGGNKFADIEHKIRKVWADDAAAWGMVDPDAPAELSKILVFCNKSTKVEELSSHLEEKGIKCVALTSTSDQRKRGSNKHLEGFLRPVKVESEPHFARTSSSTATRQKKEMDLETARDPKTTPHVMVTTSLLSRGLDFTPKLEHVFIVDEPRNMVDFLHRAGRSGRAGKKGKVVIFTKMKGRGSARGKEAKERVRELLKK